VQDESHLVRRRNRLIHDESRLVQRRNQLVQTQSHSVQRKSELVRQKTERGGNEIATAVELMSLGATVLQGVTTHNATVQQASFLATK